ncbi:MAG: 5'-3' exonuclease H3TH domain-containing protein [Candidatus Liptonbacteria bacterium]
MKQLTLIDANSLIHRAYHALPPLTAGDGEPVQALYGISMILMRLREEGSLEYAAALFDRPEPTFREEKYKEYKATRPPAPEPLVSQIISAHELFKTFGIPVFEKAGFEADDGIATLAEKFKKEPDVRVTILTGDMDTLQLVEDPRVRVRALRTGVTDTVIYDEAGVKQRLGVTPELVTSYKALVGDSSDNIKGVTGIGPKTAAELINSYGSLENIYKNIEKISGKTKQKLITGEKQAELSKELVILERNVPLQTGGIEDLWVGFEKQKIADCFERYGFKRLLARLNGETPEKTKAKTGKPAKNQQEKGKKPDSRQAAMF